MAPLPLPSLVLITTALLLPPAALAQVPQSGVPNIQASPDIFVTALVRDRADILAGTSVLSGANLDAARRTSLGETLASLPGVSASSFGPSASRPILRGLQADRIRVLIDGIGSFDVSSSSVDHAVAINPLTAERIEVLRGPSALLFGSSAIGGVVSVIDNRIPRRLPDQAIIAQLNANYATAADERRIAGAITAPLGQTGFVVHVDGSYAKSDDLNTGGFILSPRLRAQASASDDPAINDLANLKGDLPNTAAKASEAALGLAYIADGGTIGFSLSQLDNLYGVPLRFSLDPAIEAEAPKIDIKLKRVDFRGELTPASGLFEAIRLRAGYGDYRHFEIEDSGEIATRFLNKGFEGRLELSQRAFGGLTGASGVQYLTRDFNVIGDEAFLPKTKTEQLGFFTVQSFNFGALRAEIGGRYETTRVRAAPSDMLGTNEGRRRFDAFSGSLGVQYAVFPDVKLGLNVTHAERAPSVEELFSNGPHLATQAFEVGDRSFRKERSNGAEATLKGRTGDTVFEVSAYYNRFNGFIFQAPTGEIRDDLPVFAYAQARVATQQGFEIDASTTVARIGATRIVADAVLDYVRVTLKRQGPAPFIPPLRLLGGLEVQSERITGRIEIERVDTQNRVAQSETATPGYTMTNARIEWKPFGKDGVATLSLAANNIFDVTARRHSSFLSDFAPLAGRDIRLGASIRF